MAVTKTVPPERIREAYDAGQRLFGENRVQEFATKADGLRNLAEAEWHMIGHLQSNKAVKAAELFARVDSVDSLRLAQKLNTAASQLGKKLSVLIEINIGGEQVKNGVAPDSAELEHLLTGAPEFSSLEFRGLMTVPPYNDDPEQSRQHFREMRERSRIRDTLDRAAEDHRTRQLALQKRRQHVGSEPNRVHGRVLERQSVGEVPSQIRCAGPLAIGRRRWTRLHHGLIRRDRDPARRLRGFPDARAKLDPHLARDLRRDRLPGPRIVRREPVGLEPSPERPLLERLQLVAAEPVLAQSLSHGGRVANVSGNVRRGG